MERQRKPFLYRDTGPHRQVGRRALLRALAEEYEFGNSIARLYVSLLARAIIAQDPKLLKKPDDPRFLKSGAIINLERCGVRLPNGSALSRSD